MFSIVIPSFRRQVDLGNCIDSLRKNSNFNNEIIVLYNKEDLETMNLCSRKQVKYISDNARENGKRVKSLWEIINDGVMSAKSNYVLYLNDDCLVEKNWDSIALNYFKNNEKLALLVLKTKGIGNNPEFRVVNSLFGFPCANYGIIDKRFKILFDTKFSWFYGDADLPLTIGCDKRKLSVISTSENMIIHNHTIDDNRMGNESDIRAIGDEKYFYRKWRFYKYEKGIIKRMNLVDLIDKIIGRFKL